MGLNIKAFALASAIVSWLGSLMISLFVVFTGQGRQYLEMLAPFHPGGYSATVLGAVIGSVWMFIYGLILGTLFAYIYNRIAKS